MTALIISAATLFATACSPGHNAVIGIGYDDKGNLVGLLNVCTSDISKARLYPTRTPGQPDDATHWSRRPPLSNTEVWRLDVEETSTWHRSGPAPEVVANEQYQFWAENENSAYHSNVIDFHGRDLLALRPGQVLVARDGPTDSKGIPAFATATIPLASFPKENCPA